jgi:hypothetical protein
MCRNFTYQVVGQHRRLKAIKKKIVPQKINVILNVSSSWLKLCWFILDHLYTNRLTEKIL